VARTYAQHCGLARALDRIGERWTLLIVRELLLGPARYTDLRAGLPGMATNLLAERLRALEAQGIIARRRLPPPAATTVYELTELGRGLEDAVDALIRWGGRWMREAGDSDVFRPQWLALALRALTRPDRALDLPLGIRLEVDGHSFTLNVTESGVEVSAHEDSPADVVLTADPNTMLAVASGARPLAAALQSGAARAQGDPQAIEALGHLWDPGRAGAGDGQSAGAVNEMSVADAGRPNR
jgi:DNA-binding HxlR family transcriptional regulator